MAEDNWQKATKQMVMHPAGTDAFGRKRYVRANFYLMEWEGPTGSGVREKYVVPDGIGDYPSAAMTIAGKGDPIMLDDFGYFQLEPLLIENQFDDGLFELHSFGYV